jgi:hypothetical protein
MEWIIAIAALSLAMTVLTVAELGQPVKANTLRLPALSIGVECTHLGGQA